MRVQFRTWAGSAGTHAEMDSLAERFVQEINPAQAENILEHLLFEYAAPLIRTIARAKLSGSAETAQDIEDVCGEALLELIGKIEEVKAGSSAAIDRFSHYTAVVAYHACHDYFRSRYPQRHRLKNRLRYVLKPERGFDLWESPHGDWLCGWKKWRGMENVEAGQFPPTPASAPQMSAADLLAALFERVTGPIRFDDVVDWVAELWGIKDRARPLDLVQGLAAPVAPLTDDDGLRARLEFLWTEIGELPRGQRVALLLNLRSEDEKSAMELFPLTGVASMREIAARLEIPVEEFAGLWVRLPLDDRTIAEILGVSRQQVINLRKSARKRLGRRVAAIEEENQRR